MNKVDKVDTVEYLRSLELLCLALEESILLSSGLVARVKIKFHGHYEQNENLFDNAEGLPLTVASSNSGNMWRETEEERVTVFNQ